MKPRLCPKCGSPNVQVYEDVGFLRCKSCGYDELERDPLPNGMRNSQREKEKFSPYKTGGAQRSMKK